MHLPFQYNLRFPRHFIAGYPKSYPTTVHEWIRFQNPDDYVKAEVTLRCPGLVGAQHRHVVDFTRDNPCAERVLSITPSAAGNHPLTVEISLWLRGSAMPEIWVGDVHPFNQSTLTIFDSKNLGSLTINGRIIAPIGDIHSPENVNHLLRVELPSEWTCVTLTKRNTRHGRMESQPDEAARPDQWPSKTGVWKAIPPADLYMLEMPVSQRLWNLVYPEGLQRLLYQADSQLARKMSLFFTEDHPVFGVTLAEAENFCHQFVAHFRSQSVIPFGWEVRLPSHAEWLTACGAMPRILGEHCFNLSLPGFRSFREGPLPESQVRKLLKPNSNGLFALLGNLFEWCPSPEHEAEKRQAYILGGSWHPDDVPTKYHGAKTAPATRRSSRFGFRVVAVPSPSSH
jgi:formylglycine-generating enzyme required for sulfatase activity